MLTASTDAAVSPTSSSSGMIARLSGMVSEPGPTAVQLAHEPRKGRLVDLEALVRPVVEAEFGVRGAVQDRGEGVGDGRSRTAARLLAHCPCFRCFSYSATFRLCSSFVTEKTVLSSLIETK